MKYIVCLLTLLNGIIYNCTAQTTAKSDTTLTNATLSNCVQFALQHQPAIQQSLIDQQITEHQIKSQLSAWYPQINFGANYQNYFQLPATAFEGSVVPQGAYNNSNIGFSGTQNLFNRDAFLASRTARDVRTQAKQNIISNKIDVTVNVAKAFYDVLLTQKQIELTADDIVRLDRSLKDAYHQYQFGLVDKVDYKRATIALNNAKAEKKQYEESLKEKYAFLRQQMGYSLTDSLNLKYDSAAMQNDVLIDTNLVVNYQNRIEYQQLETQRKLLAISVKYYKWGYIPSLSAFAAYNWSYINNEFPPLYNNDYPNSYAGITLTLPIFQGGKRVNDIKVAQLQLQRTDYDLANLHNEVNTEFTAAMAIYKSNLTDYYLLKDNLDLSTDVYNTIQLQYKAGVKTYLDVITAESDLRSSEVNYTNALYNVLSSKFDVEKALGSIQY
ncbi:MAG TPA: TolC family protein [Ferruginibacter sp.]|nr:TolC family protein [Ferruginibacter sp.]